MVAEMEGSLWIYIGLLMKYKRRQFDRVNSSSRWYASTDSHSITAKHYNKYQSLHLNIFSLYT